MRTRPILFNSTMVRAILAGKKTVTRRVCKPATVMLIENDLPIGGQPFYENEVLWVRETWNTLCGQYIYRADQKPGMTNPGRWRPSIHMPKEAARIFLRVTDVRVERLQNMAYFDFLKEGLPYDQFEEKLEEQFKVLWDSTIKPANRNSCGWDANPWVWVIEFVRCKEPKEEK